MNQATSMFAICMLVPMIVLAASWVLASRSMEDREKSTQEFTHLTHLESHY